MKKLLAIAGIGYLLGVVAVTIALVAARNTATGTLSSERSQAAWDAWRKTAEQQSRNEYPVRRSIPRSSEPPTLVLLRDHFGICLAFSLIIASALYWTTLLFLQGACRGSASSSFRPGSP